MFHRILATIIDPEGNIDQFHYHSDINPREHQQCAIWLLSDVFPKCQQLAQRWIIFCIFSERIKDAKIAIHDKPNLKELLQLRRERCLFSHNPRTDTEALIIEFSTNPQTEAMLNNKALHGYALQELANTA